jgi:hypothetical protein
MTTEMMEEIAHNGRISREQTILRKKIAKQDRKIKSYKKTLLETTEERRNERRKAYKQLKLLYPLIAVNYRIYRCYWHEYQQKKTFGYSKRFDAGINYWNTTESKKWNERYFKNSGRYFTPQSMCYSTKFDIDEIPQLFKWLFNNDD